jgi:hypothetical protein
MSQQLEERAARLLVLGTGVLRLCPSLSITMWRPGRGYNKGILASGSWSSRASQLILTRPTHFVSQVYCRDQLSDLPRLHFQQLFLFFCSLAERSLSFKMSSGSASRNPPSVPKGHSTAKRIPTDSSYVCPYAQSWWDMTNNPQQYDFQGVPYRGDIPNSATWMYARDARAQMATEPQKQSRNDRYPMPYLNHDKDPLSTPGSKIQIKGDEKHGWMHHPLTPGTTTAYSGRGKAGGVRAIYTKDDSTKFDVYYHDRKLGTTGKSGNGVFSQATYYPRASK